MSSLKIKSGDRVRVIELPPYVKTADPMPMLRPAKVISLGEEGIVLNTRPAGYWAIRFTQGAFLLESKYFEVIESAE
ncbi:regulatory protein SipA [Geminocystis sp. CENA526]|uniref:regulatory protein SipA n=1 Tax=Geminocystis sp. CENA526 TaxID=1355871 RepID=UPI003D6E3A80